MWYRRTNLSHLRFRLLYVLVSSILLWLSISTVALAADPAPLSMLKTTANQLITQLQANRSRLQSNPSFATSLARRIILPRFDVTYMAQYALGRDAWNQATSAQRQAFIAQFTQLAINTYSAALTNFDHQTVEFSPLREFNPTQNSVEINSHIQQSGRSPIAVSYRVHRANGAWKIFDFSVEGISMLQSYRNQFASQLSANNNSVSALIQNLQQHNNRRGESRGK